MVKMNTLTPSYGVAHSKKTDTKTCDIFFNALKTTLATAMHTTNTPTSNLTDEENTRLINSYRSDEKTLISYGYPNGFTYKLEYSAKSTNENPIITVQGITEHGRYFERDIFINEINPYNATIMEMDALEAHYHLYNENGISSLPPELPTPPGLNTTYNFVNLLKKEASLMSGAGCLDWARHYTKTLQSILDIDSKHTKNTKNTKQEMEYLLSIHHRLS